MFVLFHFLSRIVGKIKVHLNKFSVCVCVCVCVWRFFCFFFVTQHVPFLGKGLGTPGCKCTHTHTKTVFQSFNALSESHMFVLSDAHLLTDWARLDWCSNFNDCPVEVADSMFVIEVGNK